MVVTKRRDVNLAVSNRISDFIEIIPEVIKGSRIVNSVNYDLRRLTVESAVEVMENTVKSACIVRKNWILARETINDIIFNLDWYISRCNTDLKKYRKKLNGKENP